MATNQLGGGKAITVREHYAIIDSLPSAIRLRIGTMVNDMHPGTVADLLRKGYSEKEVLQRIEIWDEWWAKEHWYRMIRMAEKGTPYEFLIKRSCVK